MMAKSDIDMARIGIEKTAVFLVIHDEKERIIHLQQYLLNNVMKHLLMLHKLMVENFQFGQTSFLMSLLICHL